MLGERGSVQTKSACDLLAAAGGDIVGLIGARLISRCVGVPKSYIGLHRILAGLLAHTFRRLIEAGVELSTRATSRVAVLGIGLRSATCAGRSSVRILIALPCSVTDPRNGRRRCIEAVDSIRVTTGENATEKHDTQERGKLAHDLNLPASGTIEESHAARLDRDTEL